MVRRLRISAIIIVLLGIISAETLYWFETRSPETTPDASLLGNEKAQDRQLQVLYGKSNADFQQWVDDLKNRPGEQAEIIIATAILLACGCLYLAHLRHGSSRGG